MKAMKLKLAIAAATVTSALPAMAMASGCGGTCNGVNVACWALKLVACVGGYIESSIIW